MHLALALRSAYTLFFKLKNLATCMTFCRRWVYGGGWGAVCVGCGVGASGALVMGWGGAVQLVVA